MPTVRFSPALDRKVTLQPFVDRVGKPIPRGLEWDTYNAYGEKQLPASNSMRGLPNMAMVSLHELLAATRRGSTARSAYKGLGSLIEPLQGLKEGQRVRVSTLARRLIKVAVRAIRQETCLDMDAPLTAWEWAERNAKHALAGLAGAEGVLGLLRQPDLSERNREWIACQVFARRDYKLGGLFVEEGEAALRKALAVPASRTLKKYLREGLVPRAA